MGPKIEMEARGEIMHEKEEGVGRSRKVQRVRVTVQSQWKKEEVIHTSRWKSEMGAGIRGVPRTNEEVIRGPTKGPMTQKRYERQGQAGCPLGTEM